MEIHHHHLTNMQNIPHNIIQLLFPYSCIYIATVTNYIVNFTLEGHILQVNDRLKDSS